MLSFLFLWRQFKRRAIRTVIRSFVHVAFLQRSTSRVLHALVRNADLMTTLLGLPEGKLHDSAQGALFTRSLSSPRPERCHSIIQEAREGDSSALSEEFELTQHARKLVECGLGMLPPSRKTSLQNVRSARHSITDSYNSNHGHRHLFHLMH
jgi:hypothetical protein